jgi:hypothetical protein
MVDGTDFADYNRTLFFFSGFSECFLVGQDMYTLLAKQYLGNFFVGAAVCI